MGLRCIDFLIILFTTVLASHPTPTPSPTSSSSAKTTPPSTHFFPTQPPGITSLDSAQVAAAYAAMSSVDATWVANVLSYKYLESEIFLAAPTDAQLSLAVNGYSWDAIVRQTWYQTGVGAQWKEMVNKQETALQSAFNEAIGGAERVGGRGLGGFSGVGWIAVLVGMVVLGVILL